MYSDDELLTAAQAGAYLGVTPSTLTQQKNKGYGPPVVQRKPGAKLYYKFKDLEAYRLKYNECHQTKLEAHLPHVPEPLPQMDYLGREVVRISIPLEVAKQLNHGIISPTCLQTIINRVKAVMSVGGRA